jgi:hypothetical protein
MELERDVFQSTPPRGPGLMVPIMDDDDLREHLTARLGSGAWWIFVAANPSAAADCLLEIEKRFYSGSHANDFELAIIPWRLGPPIVVIACARKRRMSSRKLLCILAEFMRPEALSVTCDALVAGSALLLLDGDSPTDSHALMMALLEFFQRGLALLSQRSLAARRSSRLRRMRTTSGRMVLKRLNSGTGSY